MVIKNQSVLASNGKSFPSVCQWWMTQLFGFFGWHYSSSNYSLKKKDYFYKVSKGVPYNSALPFVVNICQFSAVSSVAQSCLTLCDPMNHSTPGLPVHHQLLEFTQTHAHRVGDAIQPSHPLSSPSPSAPNPSQHQSLFQWVSSSHEVAKVLEFQLQHQSFQWTPRTDLT